MLMTLDDVRSLTAGDLICGEWLDAKACAVYLGQHPDKADCVVKMKKFPAPEWAKETGEPLWHIAAVSGWAAQYVKVARRDEETCLYRHFDDKGRLLYVGISLCALQRTSQHRHLAGWFRKVANITLEWHPTRQSAEAAELAAIESERPIHNVAGRPKLTRKRKSPAIAEIVQPQEIAKNIGGRGRN